MGKTFPEQCQFCENYNNLTMECTHWKEKAKPRDTCGEYLPNINVRSYMKRWGD